MAIEIALFGDPHRVGVQLDDQPVDPLGDLLARQCVPGRRVGGQLGVDGGQRVGVGEQVGAKDRRGDHPKVHRTGQKHRTQRGEALQQCGAVVHLRGRPPPADPQLGADLGGDGLPVIDTPDVVLAGRLLHPAQGEPAHRQQLARERRPLGLLGSAHQIEQLRITTLFEHIFDYRRH